jgi:hypothetical protein
MHPHAPNPAAQPHLSLTRFSVCLQSREERNGSGERSSFYGTQASRNELRLGRTFAAEKRDADFGPEGFIRLVSRLLHGHCFGAYPAPCGSALFCFDYVALRVTVSSFAGPSANAELGTWEPGPLRLLVTRARSGNST